MKTQQAKDCPDLVPTCGRIDFAPDYKSEKKLPTIKEMSGSINFGGRVVFEGEEQIVVSGDELKARLERAVVEAAKRDRLVAQQGDGSNRDIDSAIDTRRAL